LVHADFFIVGRYAEPVDAPKGRFYFDRGSAVLDQGEAAKAARFAGARVSDLRLRATVSEDEDPGLLTARIDAVEQALLLAAPGTGPAQREEKPLAGKGNKDYRLVRRVQVFDTTMAPTGPDCSQGPQQPCPSPNPFLAVRDRVYEMIEQALQALRQVDHGPAGPVMDQYFHGRQHAPQVAAGLTAIARQLPLYRKEIPKGSPDQGGYRCHNECDPIVASNEGEGKEAIMTVGPKFLQSKDTDKLALTILHEASHAAIDLVTEDLAYDWQRLLPFLPVERAVKNADSYAALVGAIIGRPVGNTVGPDQYAATISAADQRGTTEMIGWLEQYVVHTRQEAGSLHLSMSKATGAGWWMKGTYRDQIFPALGAAFPEATRPADIEPTTVPTADHIATAAGCYDRLSKLHAAITNRKLTITPAADDQVTWQNTATGPGPGVALPASFFGKSGQTRVELLLDAMLAAGAVEPARIAGYRQFILARGTLTGQPN